MSMYYICLNISTMNFIDVHTQGRQDPGYIKVNMIAVDALAMQGARASAGTVLTTLTWIN